MSAFLYFLRPCMIAHQPLLSDRVDLVIAHQLAERLAQLIRQLVALHTDGRRSRAGPAQPCATVILGS
ncbi:MAG TPA: hypothetical protein PK472_00660 [Pseudomonadota bacterium]|nr:hypothetical protein [Pseudomonadota bacterium]HNN53688.1 hypothetical protein [Pseudomonadota bacterium]